MTNRILDGNVKHTHDLPSTGLDMGLFDKLKSGLAEAGYIDATAEHKTPASTPAPSPNATSLGAIPAGITLTSGTTSGGEDPSITKTLRDQLERRSTIREYATFRTLLTAMEGLPDMTLRYSMALKALTAGHAIPATKVMDALQERLTILAAEEQTFLSRLSQHRDTTVADTQKRMAELDQAGISIAAQIAELQAQQMKLQGERTELSTKTTAVDKEVKETQMSFEVSVRMIRDELSTEITRVKSSTLPTP